MLILVFNAAESCHQMAQLFPEHVIRHYQYLRDSIPDLVPQQIKVRVTWKNIFSICSSSEPQRLAQVIATSSVAEVMVNSAELRANTKCCSAESSASFFTIKQMFSFRALCFFDLYFSNFFTAELLEDCVSA